MKTSNDRQTQLKNDNNSEKGGLFFTAKLILKNIALLPVRLIVYIANQIGDLFKFSLTYRIGTIYIILALVVLIVFQAGILSSFHFLWLRAENNQIDQAKNAVVKTIRNIDKINNEMLDQLAAHYRYDIQLYDNAQKYVYQSNSNLPDLQYNIKKDVATTLKLNDLHFFTSSRQLVVSGQVYYIQLVKDVSEHYNNIKRLIYIGGALIVILTTAVAYFGTTISRSLLNPISAITEQIKQITVKRLDIRLDASNVQNELKELTLQFNSLLDEIEDAYSKQNQFVSDASHELRTPISVINGYVSMLDRWGKKDQAILDESIQAIKGETYQMKELIEKLLFLARSDRNKIEMEIDKLALDQLVQEICRETKMIDSSHDIQCLVNGQSQIYGNEKLIKQMMRIFIENAIKFTEEGGSITIGMDIVGEKTVLYVKDTGIGIAKTDIAKVFDRFYRTDKSRTKKSGGTGLGLSIAKWIADQHQARVKLYSEVGVGTKIEVWFNKKIKLVTEDDIQ